MRKLKLYTIMLTLLSFSAFANVGTPGGVFRDITDFFKGIFTGGASIEQAYLISFLLYFIIFMAVYIEGIRAIPIFGASGESNRQGTIFAVAAAALSTLALFIVDTTSNMTTTERVNQLIAPWGIWGGVAIAALIAFITYRLIIQSDAFSDQVLTAMAIAAAVGVTLAGFLLSLELLVGWGFLIALLAFVVGFIRGFMNYREEGSEDRATSKKARREAEVKRFKDADDARKKRKEDAKEAREKKRGEPRRRSATRNIVNHLIEVAKDYGDLDVQLDDSPVTATTLTKSTSLVNNIGKELKLARDKLQALSTTSTEYSDSYEKLRRKAAAAYIKYNSQIKVILPTAFAGLTPAIVTTLKGSANTLQTAAAALNAEVLKFVKEGTI
jgi:ABC-type multidrug transport system fused ATPase/permease subunit